jgi:CubicO group peptidase (beta-lactamase class C family)
MSAQTPLLFEPGSSFNYGAGCNIAAALVEVVSGVKFGEYLQNNIFQPLNMRDTGLRLPLDKTSRAAKLYTLDEDGKLKYIPSQRDWLFAPEAVFESGAGGLVSTMGDMDTFVRMLSSGGALNGTRILGRKTVDLIRQNHLRGEALEAFRHTHESGWEWHAGYGFGLGCAVLIDRTLAGCNGSIGEYGWYGAAGTMQFIDPVEEMTVTYAHMLMPENLASYCHPRLRAVLYSCLD